MSLVLAIRNLLAGCGEQTHQGGTQEPHLPGCEIDGVVLTFDYRNDR